MRQKLLESKRNCLEKEIATLQFDADRLAKEAEAKMPLVLLTESNALRAAAKVKGRDLEKVNNELKELVKKCQHRIEQWSDYLEYVHKAQ